MVVKRLMCFFLIVDIATASYIKLTVFGSLFPMRIKFQHLFNTFHHFPILKLLSVDYFICVSGLNMSISMKMEAKKSHTIKSHETEYINSEWHT